MALTSDEEDQLRALLAAIRRLPVPVTMAATVQIGPVQRAFSNLEGYLRDLVSRLRG